MSALDEFTQSKLCYGCDTRKPLSEFHLRASKSVVTDRHQNKCKPCSAKYNQAYNARNRERRRELRRLKEYGLSQEGYLTLLTAQEYKCASCGDEFEGANNDRESLQTALLKHIHVDHCHVTNEVRGILCHHCNIALGHLKDDAQRIQNLLDYLNDAS